MNQPSPSRPNIAPPPSKRKSTILPSNDLAPADNMQGERLAPMTFNMPREWHMRFKMTSVARGISMKDLLIEAFAAWEREQRAKESAK